MLGFSRKENAVIIFLSSSFIIGVVIWLYREHWEPLPEILSESNYSISRNEYLDAGKNSREVKPDSLGVLININKAGKEELERLPGIGPVTAGRIIRFRNQAGQFKSVEELVRVKGIGPKTISKLKPYLTI